MNQLRLNHNSKLKGIVPPSLATVVVVHGWASNRLDMWLFCRRLRGLGYNVVNWGYSSTKRSITEHAEAFGDLLFKVQSNSNREYLHLVGHSMGGIVIRKALTLSAPDTLARVVMLASPNGGSFVARRLSPWLGWYSNTLTELSDRPDSLVNQLGDMSSVDVGVLAASRDRVIKEDRVHVAGESDFAVLDSGHGVMPWKRTAVISTHRFLMTGRFQLRSRS